GAEPDLEANLASFCAQAYPGPVQIVFGVSEAADPAAAIVRRLITRFPDIDIELVVGTRMYGGNRKISNLINMAPRSPHTVIVHTFVTWSLLSMSRALASSHVSTAGRRIADSGLASPRWRSTSTSCLTCWSRSGWDWPSPASAQPSPSCGKRWIGSVGLSRSPINWQTTTRSAKRSEV